LGLSVLLEFSARLLNHSANIVMENLPP
jgi:hypothetical protein